MAKDRKIGNKYLAKNNVIIASNYFNAILAFAGMSAMLFLLQPSIIMIIIFCIMTPLYFLLYKKKNKSIITSVTIYSYQTVFMEILFKSFKLNKDLFLDIKNMFNKKTNKGKSKIKSPTPIKQ